jgi:hypothetical protein
MRKVLLVAVFIFVVNALFGPAQAQAETQGPCRGMGMQATIVCAERLWPIPGGSSTALYIGNRESGFRPDAVSPSGTYLGIFQIGSYHMPAWPNELMPQPWFHRWFPRISYSDSASLLNGRFNVFLGIRAMHSWGLGPWSL